jgi:hypothetical protein
MPKAAVNRSNAELGFQARVGREFRKCSKSVRKEFYQFVRREVPKLFKPLAPDTEFDVDDWLNNSSYNQKRRTRLKMLHDEFSAYSFNLPRKYLRCKGFIKDENYPEYKNPRTINSRSDVFKAIVGKYFHKIDKGVFSEENVDNYDPKVGIHFVKHIPVNDRPAYIIEKCGLLGPYIATDYSSFESSFDPKFMLACEMVVYDHMLSLCPDHDRVMRLLRNAMCGYNQCYFKWFRSRVYGRRMSGEMCTSSGNGVTNMLLMRFMAFRLGSCIQGVVEGDDGLFSVTSGPLPSTQDLADLGFDVKLVSHNALNEASFCGLIFDLDERCNIMDPVKVVSRTPWSLRRYVLSKPSTLGSLLRCKAFSLMALYAGCPVIQEYAMYILRCTRNLDIRRIVSRLGWWERELWRQVKPVDEAYRVVGWKTRSLMERIYGITIERQLEMESYFRNQRFIKPVPYDLFAGLIPLTYELNYTNFTRYAPTGHPDMRWS